LAAAALPADAAPKVTVKLLKDINPGPDSSGPERFVRLGDSAYFVAYSPDSGGELWKTDGTRAGTQVVSDLVPGAKGSIPRGVRATDRYVFFTVLQPDRTRRLWRTDGTEAGTMPVPGTADMPVASDLSATGDHFFFATYPPQSATYPAPPELDRVWVTDGDSEPVEIGTGGSFESASLGGNAYLPLAGPADGEFSLWRTDGTTAGTTPVKSGLGLSGPVGLTAVGSALYFFGSDSTGSALWRTDGATTTRIADLSGERGGFPDTAAVGGRFVFTVNGQLRSSDGTAVDALVDSQADYLQLDPQGARAYLSVHGRLWRTDGTPEGTRLVSGRARSPWGYANAGRTTLFTAVSHNADPHGARVLWRTDGTASGTSVISGPSLDHRRNFTSLTSLGHRVVFAAKDRHHGLELFVARVR
jgi:ELWxxDGT repeat protein